MAKRKKKPLLSAKFKVGDKVRVKHGVEDVDYPASEAIAEWESDLHWLRKEFYEGRFSFEWPDW